MKKGLSRDRVKQAITCVTLFDNHLPSGGEVVLLLVNNCFLKDIASLLSDTLANELVVDLHVWDIALVAWDHGRLLSYGALFQRLNQRGQRGKLTLLDMSL